MSEPLVLGRPGGPRWVIHPPQDPYGDGYVFTVDTELHADGMTASTVANLDGVVVDPNVTRLPNFVETLAADWQGWDGLRTWRSLEEQLALDARHDRCGYVSLGVTLREPGLDLEGTAWSARAVFVLEAGEEMTQLAVDLSHFLRT